MAVDERLYALFHLVAFRGLRRAEVAGLSWQDTDLTEAGTITNRETLADEDDDTKSEAGERTVALDATTISVLRSWREHQQKERLAAGADIWVDPGRAFTRADGRPLRPQWISTRFDDLIEMHGRASVGGISRRAGRRTRSRGSTASAKGPCEGRSKASRCRRSASTTCAMGRPRWRCSARST